MADIKWALAALALLLAAGAPVGTRSSPAPPPPLPPKPGGGSGDAFFAVPLTWETDDFQYYATFQVGVGQPGSFRLLLDTGSANVWVPGSGCTTAACKGRTLFDPASAGSFQFNGGSQVQITYGDTFISGTTGRAPMAINGTFVNINATSGAALPPDGGDDDEEGALEFTQGVVVASSVAGGALGGAPRRAPWDGLLGMGRPALAVGWMQPPVVSMAEQGRLPAAVFGLWLSHDARGEGRGGELALGGWNAARTQGGVHWVPLVPSPAGQQGYWSVALDAVALSGGAWAQPETVLCGALPAGAAAGAAGAAAIRVASNGGASGCVGALDSGTSLLTSTPHQVGHLNRRLGFRPGPPPLPGGTAACGGEVDRLMAVIIQAGGEDPGSSQLSSICQGMGSGPLSPQATLCALVLANIDAARGALQGGRGFPTQQTLAAARNASVEDCGLLPYSFNATLDCSKVSWLPNISFVIGGHAYNVTPSQYSARGPGGECYSLVSSLGSLPPNLWILGDTLMHNIYTIFDNGHNGSAPRIGLAALGPAEEALRRELDAALEAPTRVVVESGAGRGGRLGGVLGSWGLLLVVGAAAWLWGS